MTRQALQTLMWPDPDLAHDTAVFLRLSGDASLTGAAGTPGVTLGPGGAALFDTYANLFNLGTWAAQAPVTALALDLRGTGDVTLHLWQVTANAPDQTLIRADLTLSPTGTTLPLTPATPEGLLLWSVTARGPATLTGATFSAAASGAPEHPVALAIVITTFRREDAVQKTAARIAALLAAGQLPGAHLFVIDNGDSVTLPAHPDVTLIRNRNLGGAGGFARGLAAARAAGHFSHVLFMDDDAAFQMENLTRTAAFLRHARDPATALAGAMVSAAEPWRLWENGAIFDAMSRSRFKGTDLRDPAAVTAMELAVSNPPPQGLYGAWWYFAFPLASVTHDPFPFFVRGDDVWFGLSNRFRIATLNGVMSLQDDFAAKASPQTLYLDLRYLVVVNMVRPGPRMGPLGIIRLAMRQILHSVSQMHYETAAAQLLAWEDLLAGPGHFTDNITMTDKRAQIAALVQVERWGPPPATLPPVQGTAPPPGWRLTLQRATLNGHLLPGFGLWARAVTVPLAGRGWLWSVRGARRATFVNDAGQAYTVTHSKRAFVRLMARATGLALRWLIAWPRLSRQYRAAMGPMTTPGFWTQYFTLFPD